MRVFWKSSKVGFGPPDRGTKRQNSGGESQTMGNASRWAAHRCQAAPPNTSWCIRRVVLRAYP